MAEVCSLSGGLNRYFAMHSLLKDRVGYMKLLVRALLMITVTFSVVPAYANDEAYFSTFMMVCAKGIHNISSVSELATHFKLKPLPKSSWPDSAHYKGWFFAVEKQKYILSVDKIEDRNICAMEAADIDADKIRLIMEGFFNNGGEIALVKKLPNDETYVWQEYYTGKLPSFGIDNIFTIKKRKESVVLVVAELKPSP